MTATLSWQVFAVGSAVFAAFTAILGKIGVANLNSDLATWIRTLVILLVTTLLVSARGEWQKPGAMSWLGWTCLLVSGLTTALSWLCYFRALQLGPITMVAPIDKMSVALVLIAGWAFMGEPLTLKSAVGAGLVVLGTIILIK